MPADPIRLEEVFIAAAEIPEADRSAYLDKACGADLELRAAVDRLLVAHAEPASILRTAAVPPPSTELHSPQPDMGTVLAGRYTLLEEIGEGGMGTVWMARQTEPVKRMVAVKLIKPGMDSKAVLARFEAERQALAIMDHPNIARVLDAGLASDGRPFFVMDLVKGVPITQFCDARKLSPRERLELFVPVCQAIQHAHQKGIIHRDIKPNNVLVALYDDRPVPKVIDFGVAKATGQPLTEQSLHTGFGTVVGTPEYMSPEQATFNNLDIDTRSDLYSLGVLLYELLTGTTPMDKKSLGKAALIEVLRIVREVEAPRPSARLSTMDTLPSIAANRSTEPSMLGRLLKRELDWVVLKAMEKDRARRYDSANAFAADVQRYLDGEAVLAHPPSSAYRLRKFIHKNRAAMITVAAFVGLLIVATTVSSWSAVIAKRAERLAEDRRIETEENAEKAKRAEGLAEIKRIEAEENAARADESIGEYFNMLERALRSKIDAEILATRLQIDLDLATLREEPKVGLLRLARLRKKETQLEFKHKLVGDGTISLPDVEKSRYRDLHEFLTAAVLTTGQDYAQLLPPITHDGQEIAGLWHSPDYRTLLTLGTDGTARTWETRTGRQIAVLRKGNERIVNCGISGDGKTAFTEDETGIARFWEPSGKFCSQTLPRPNAYMYVALKDGVESLISFDPHYDGAAIKRDRFLAKGVLVEQRPGDPKGPAQTFIPYVELWDISTGQRIARWTSREAFDTSSFSFQGDGRWITANEGKSTVAVFSADDGKLAGRLKLPENASVENVGASPSGRKILINFWDSKQHTVWIWDTESWRRAGSPINGAREQNYRIAVYIHFWTDDLIGFQQGSIGGANDDDVPFTDVIRLGQPATTFTIDSNVCIPLLPSGDFVLTDGGKIIDTKAPGPRLSPPTGHKYHPTLSRFAADGRFVIVDKNMVDTLTDKSFPSPEWPDLGESGYQPGFGFLTAALRDVNVEMIVNNRVERTKIGTDLQVRLLPTAALKDIPLDLLELWIKVVLRGELGSDGAYVKWDEPTWEKKRQELATKKAPIADFPFPGHVATDRLHWLRAEFEAAEDANKPRLAKQLLARAEAAGDKIEANRWRKWLEASAKHAELPKK